MNILPLIENFTYESHFIKKEYNITIIGSWFYENKRGFYLNIENKRTKERLNLTFTFHGDMGFENWEKTCIYASFKIPEAGEYKITVKGVKFISFHELSSIPFPFSTILKYLNLYSTEIDKENIHLKIT